MLKLELILISTKWKNGVQFDNEEGLYGCCLRNTSKLYILSTINTNYRKVASSRPVYYSILETFGQRSQYIGIKFPLHKHLKVLGCAFNQDNLLLTTLRCTKKAIWHIAKCRNWCFVFL